MLCGFDSRRLHVGVVMAARPSRFEVLAGICLTLLVGAFAILDRRYGVSLLLPWLLSAIAVGSVVGWLGLPERAWWPRAVVLAVLLAAMFGIRAINWNSRKPFLRDLYSLRRGMVRSEVERRMGHHLQGTGWPANPMTDQPGELVFPETVVYRHTNEGWGNSDWGVVEYDSDRVVKVEFMPD